MIELINISKSFSDKEILSNVNIRFKPNKISVITGKSGEGKTTLFRIISGLENTDTGFIRKDDFDRVGMVFQGNELYPHFSVLGNLLVPQRVVLKRSKQESTIKALEVLESLNITYLKDASTKSLSGGEAQRVAIARELVMDRNIILFDEPTSALDKENVDGLIRMIKQLKKDKTILIITHDMSFAKDINDYIYTIKNKEVLIV
jgi:polar amino acid transport system ATP-binding protein